MVCGCGLHGKNALGSWWNSGEYWTRSCDQVMVNSELLALFKKDDPSLHSFTFVIDEMEDALESLQGIKLPNGEMCDLYYTLICLVA